MTNSLPLLGVLLATTAYAQPDATPPAAPWTQPAVTPDPAPVKPPEMLVEPEPAVRIGFELALLPLGSLGAAANGQSASTDTETAFGLGAVLQHPIDSTFTMELVPRLLLNVKGTNDTDSAKELDLRVRGTAGTHVAPNVRLYAALEPGYSMLFLPGNASNTPSGPTIGVAAGAAITVAPKTLLTAELGYQFGWQSTNVMGVDVDINTQFLHVAAGVLFDL
jgi:hypothetical protein